MCVRWGGGGGGGGGGGFVDSQTSRSLDSSKPYGKYLTNSRQIDK